MWEDTFIFWAKSAVFAIFFSKPKQDQLSYED